MSSDMKIRLIPGALARYCDQRGISRNALARQIGVTPETAYRVDHDINSVGNFFIAALLNEVGGPDQFPNFFEIQAA